MALNPNIPLGARVAQAPNLLQMMKQAGQVREQQANRKVRRRDEEYNTRLGDLMQSGQGTAPMNAMQANQHMLGEFPQRGGQGLRQAQSDKIRLNQMTREGKKDKETERLRRVGIVAPAAAEYFKNAGGDENKLKESWSGFLNYLRSEDVEPRESWNPNEPTPQSLNDLKMVMAQSEQNQGGGQFAPVRYQSRPSASGEYMGFNPADNTFSPSLDQFGQPVKYPENVTWKENESGQMVAFPSKNIPNQAPKPIPGFTAKGTEKAALDRTKTRVAIKQAKVALKKADIDFKKAETLAADGGQFSSGQYKVAGYGNRMVQAEKVYNQLISEGFDPASMTTALVRNLPEAAKTPLIKSYLQAQENFVTAVLRPESGAVISDSEFAREEKKYFPQVGDDERVLEQKENSRMAKQAETQAEAGGAFGEVVSKYEALIQKRKDAKNSRFKKKPKPVKTGDFKSMDDMTPEEIQKEIEHLESLQGGR